MLDQEKTRDRKSNCEQLNGVSLNEAAWIDLQDVRDCPTWFIPLAFYSAAGFLRRRILGTQFCRRKSERNLCA